MHFAGQSPLGLPGTRETVGGEWGMAERENDTGQLRDASPPRERTGGRRTRGSSSTPGARSSAPSISPSGLSSARGRPAGQGGLPRPLHGVPVSGSFQGLHLPLISCMGASFLSKPLDT